MRKINKSKLILPESICFRVTRNCNARCDFCLAPPEGEQPDEETLKHRIDWLLAHGVNIIHFCGGEPTVHPALSELLSYVQSNKGKCKLTTNGIVVDEHLLSVLRETNTEVKVSLHGDKIHHNAMMGVTSFKHTTRNIYRMIAAGVRVSIQSTLVAGHEDEIEWLIDFCMDAGIKRLSILPFIPRGNGANCGDRFALTSQQRRDLRDKVKQRRHSLCGQLDVRWLDFSGQPFYVVEPNGWIVAEAAMETKDEFIHRIPDADGKIAIAEHA